MNVGAELTHSIVAPEPSTSSHRVIEADLCFARGGGRTFLSHQYVPYPFHITKPHSLHPGRPEFATLCLQSASGGLYRDDRLELAIVAGPGAAAHVTSQAATVVHTAAHISLHTRLCLKKDSFLAVVTDPYVLFPGTNLMVSTDVVVDPSAFAIVSEGFDWHDPASDGRPFERLANRTCVRDARGVLLVDDESRITGADLVGAASPYGPYRAVGSAMILSDADPLDPTVLQAELGAWGLFSGISMLPNAAGAHVRLMAFNGGHLSKGLRRVYVHAFERRFGFAPAARR